MQDEAPVNYSVNPVRWFLIAVQFLTRIPVKLKTAPAMAEIGYSILTYPFVGLVIGIALVSPMLLLEILGFSPPPAAAAGLLIFLWVFITGALHLDGLADSADGWLGGFGDRERTLEIMKDPRSGAGALAAVVAVLLMKFGALQAVVTEGQWLIIIATPVIGRAAVLLLVISTRYVPTSQLGADLASHCPRPAAISVLIVIAALLFVGSCFEWRLIAGTAAVLIGFCLLRRQMLQRLGGATGDTTGASVEILETVFLLAIGLLL